MGVGVLNPKDVTRSTTTRPPYTPSGINQRRWFDNSLSTEVSDKDLNDVLAQIRFAMDFYSVLDVEGADDGLQKAIAAGAGTLTGNLAQFQAMLGAANKVPYFTSVSAMSNFTATSYSRDLMSKTSQAQWRDALGISASVSANVIALGDLPSGTDKLPYFNGVGTMDQTLFTSFGRQIVGGVDAAAVRTTLALGTAAQSNVGDFATAASVALKSNIASPVFTGTPAAPTPAANDNTTKLATTAYVQAELTGLATSDISGLVAALALKADLASPALTGTPTAPTQAAANNTTRLATTAFVRGEITALGLGTASTHPDTDFATPASLALKANIASPAFTGVPVAPTPIAADNTTKIATTAFVHTEIVNLDLGVLSSYDTIALSQLDDVVVTAAVVGQHLKWNGTDWVNDIGMIVTATGQRVDIQNNQIFLGTAGADYGLYKKDGAASLIISGSTDKNLGANIWLDGETDAQPSRGYLRCGAVGLLTFDPTSNLQSLVAHSFTSGTLAAPGIAFTGDLDTGIRRIGVNNIALVVGGVDSIVMVPGGAANFPIPALFTDGGLGAPGLAFSGDTDTGIRRIGANNMSLVVGGVDAAVIAAGGITDFPVGLTAPTQIATDDSTKVATTAFVQSLFDVTSFADVENFAENPSLDLWQAGTTFALGGAVATQLADRWKGQRNTGGTTVSRQTGYSGAKYCIRFQRDVGNTATGNMILVHQMDPDLVRQFQGKRVVLSADIRVGANFSESTIAMSVHTGTANELFTMGNVPSFPTGHVAQTAFAAATVTAARFSTEAVAITIPTNALALAIRFSMGPLGTAGAADYFEITNVKLEISDTASEFHPKPVSDVLDECERFYCKSFELDVTPANNTGIGYERGTHADATLVFKTNVAFPRRMRVVPTITFYNPISATAGQAYNIDKAVASNSVTTVIKSDRSMRIAATFGSANLSIQDDVAIHWVADARW